MQLEKGERSIIASFPSSTKAEKAVEELKQNGYETVDIRRVSKYGITYDAEYNNPINRAESLSALTQYSEGTVTRDVGILLGADPAASGMASGGELIGGKAFMVVVVTNEEGLDKAVEILEKNGGEV